MPWIRLTDRDGNLLVEPRWYAEVPAPGSTITLAGRSHTLTTDPPTTRVQTVDGDDGTAPVVTLIVENTRPAPLAPPKTERDQAAEQTLEDRNRLYIVRHATRCRSAAAAERREARARDIARPDEPVTEPAPAPPAQKQPKEKPKADDTLIGSREICELGRFTYKNLQTAIRAGQFPPPVRDARPRQWDRRAAIAALASLPARQPHLTPVDPDRASDYLDMSAMCAMYGLSVGSIRNGVESGTIPAPSCRRGQGPLWDRATVAEWREQRAKLIDCHELCELVGLSRDTVLYRVETGRLPAPVEGGRGRKHMWDRADVMKAIETWPRADTPRPV